MGIRVYYFGPKGAHTPQRRPAHALLLQTSWALKRILDTLKRILDTLKRILDTLKRILETLKRVAQNSSSDNWCLAWHVPSEQETSKVRTRVGRHGQRFAL